jgi:GrpB-like predicted nucleotidyltransferase (UPF0157 family)
MTIVEYKKEWKEYFDQIKEILEKHLTKILKIEHIGSTAIIGMCAKSIIDIDIVIENNEDFEKIKNELELIGYSHNGDQGISGREAFKRNNIIKNEILDTVKHHLYVCTKDNKELKRHIFFRDYLNKNTEAMKKYKEIKYEIINEIGNEDRKNYQEIKESNKYKYFFDSIYGKMKEIENGCNFV